jgi:hypothetical protein
MEKIPAARNVRVLMKTFLLLASVSLLLTTTGCIVSEGGRRGHGHGRYEGEVMVGPPVVVVRPPVVVVPAVRVRVE